tara:strand:- start:2630 stop:2875 length:246 start_codon:yes stop_codon:yes gene_type:complete
MDMAEEEERTLSEVDTLTLISSDRLVFIRILEKFANEIDAALRSLKNDAAEIERQIGVRNSAMGQVPVDANMEADEVPAEE